MSKNPVPAQLQPPVSQLPVECYVSTELFELEKKLIFGASASYVGHELMVPEVNDYRTMESTDHGRMLIRQPDGVYDMSNVCRHRQAMMLQGQGNSPRIVCPIHHWTYDADGRLAGAPHFPVNPCLNLERKKLENWRGLLFKGPRSAAADLAESTLAQEFDFSGYKLNRVVVNQCNYNWKTFIEVYSEDYHVDSFHPGLGRFVSCDKLLWEFGDWYSVQRVGSTFKNNSGTEAYGRWQQAISDYGNGELPKHGAIWFTYYPNVMIEWYPHVLVVSSLIPQAVDKTLQIVEFYYPEDIALFEPELIAAQQAAYMETAREDDEIAERMDRGRRALFAHGRNEVGPYQSPMEDGMQHFHEFYRRCMSMPPQP